MALVLVLCFCLPSLKQFCLCPLSSILTLSLTFAQAQALVSCTSKLVSDSWSHPTFLDRLWAACLFSQVPKHISKSKSANNKAHRINFDFVLDILLQHYKVFVKQINKLNTTCKAWITFITSIKPHNSICIHITCVYYDCNLL